MLRRQNLVKYLTVMGGGAPAAAFVGAYDAIANLVHIYEPARRVLSAYSGNLVLLRRASDNAELAFGALANGDLDVAAIAAWAGGASYVVTVYDQIGSDNITQATTANQPLFTASAQNGHAGMTFDGSNDYLQGAYTNGGALSQPFGVYAVAKIAAGVINGDGNFDIADSDDAINRMILRYNGGATPDNWAINGGAWLQGGTVDANPRIWSVLFNGASSQFWHNGGSIAAGNAGAHNPDGITIGAEASASACFEGIICTVIIADPAHSDAQRIAMETAMNSYWNVF